MVHRREIIREDVSSKWGPLCEPSCLTQSRGDAEKREGVYSRVRQNAGARRTYSDEF